MACNRRNSDDLVMAAWAEMKMVWKSAIPDAGDFLKRLSAHPAAMSASNFFEPSLSTQYSNSVLFSAILITVGR